MSKPIDIHQTSSHHQQIHQNLPPLKQKSNIVKQKVPPPVPPRGSPKVRRGGGNNTTSSSSSSKHNSGTLNEQMLIEPTTKVEVWLKENNFVIPKTTVIKGRCNNNNNNLIGLAPPKNPIANLKYEFLQRDINLNECHSFNVQNVAKNYSSTQTLSWNEIDTNNKKDKPFIEITNTLTSRIEKFNKTATIGGDDYKSKEITSQFMKEKDKLTEKSLVRSLRKKFEKIENGENFVNHRKMIKDDSTSFYGCFKRSEDNLSDIEREMRKREIIGKLSNYDLKKGDANYDYIMNAFNLEGVFV